jgi:hypothetical protein
MLIGISVTCNNVIELCLCILCMEHVDATFSAFECVLTFLMLCVIHSVVFCSYECSVLCMGGYCLCATV